MTGDDSRPPSLMACLQPRRGRIDATRLSVGGTKKFEAVGILRRSCPWGRGYVRAVALRIQQGSSFAPPVAFHFRISARRVQPRMCQGLGSVELVVSALRDGRPPFHLNPLPL